MNFGTAAGRHRRPAPVGEGPEQRNDTAHVERNRFHSGNRTDFIVGTGCFPTGHARRRCRRGLVHDRIPFRAESTRTRTAILRIADSAPGSPQSVTLRGVGTQGYYVAGVNGGVVPSATRASTVDMFGGHCRRRSSGSPRTPNGAGYWLARRRRRDLRVRERAVLRFDRRDAAQPARARRWRRRRPARATGSSPATAGSSRSATRGSSARPVRCSSTSRSSGWRRRRRARATGSSRPTAGSSRSATRGSSARPARSTSTSRSSGWRRRRSGKGYWLVARDGGIFTFGDARFHGSPAAAASAPIIGMAVTPAGGGYWLSNTAGQVFTYGERAVLRRRLPSGRSVLVAVGCDRTQAEATGVRRHGALSEAVRARRPLRCHAVFRASTAADRPAPGSAPREAIVVTFPRCPLIRPSRPRIQCRAVPLAS